MSETRVSIQLFGDPTKKEYAAAEQLSRNFDLQLSPADSGEILLYAGAKLFGQIPTDVDILLVARFPKGLVRRVSWGDNNNEQVAFYNIVACIEVKDHIAQDIEFEELAGAWVPYNGKFHNATEQSESQKYSTVNYLTGRFGWAPFVRNFLWFRNLEQSELPPFPNNFFAGDFTMIDFLQKCCGASNSKSPYQRADGDIKWAYFACKLPRAEQLANEKQKLFELYARQKASLGLLTRQKLENITRTKLLSDQKYVESIGSRLVVFRGRAGTGKTIKLLHIAYDLCVHHGKRVLILTYNKMLASDLERTLALADITSDIDASSVEINTIHKFIFELLKHFAIQFDSDHFVEEPEYFRAKASLQEYITTGLLNHDDIDIFKKQYQRMLGWDNVLVDEGQDWPEDEKDILFALFGSGNVVVASGTAQLVRSTRNTDWTVGVEYHKPIIGERRTLRQKRNLCGFEDAYAAEFGINWDLEPNADLPGGKLTIVKGDYTKALHEQLMKKCKKDGNEAYEYLFLVPPSLTVPSESGVVAGRKRERCFKLSALFESWGIDIWDGVTRSQRSEYPVNVEEHRVVPYDSSRGLEGWVVVCMFLDDFVDYKRQCTYLEEVETPQMTLKFSSAAERAERLVHHWVLIALTRAIDSVVITLANPHCEFSKRLLKVAAQCADYVTIVDGHVAEEHKVKQEEPPAKVESRRAEVPTPPAKVEPRLANVPAPPAESASSIHKNVKSTLISAEVAIPDPRQFPEWLQQFFLQLMVPAPRTFRLRCRDNKFTLHYDSPCSTHPKLPQILPDFVSNGSFQILKRSFAGSTASALPAEAEEIEYGLTTKGISIAHEIRRLVVAKQKVSDSDGNPTKVTEAEVCDAYKAAVARWKSLGMPPQNSWDSLTSDLQAKYETLKARWNSENPLPSFDDYWELRDSGSRVSLHRANISQKLKEFRSMH